MSPAPDHDRDGADALGLAGTFPRPGWVVIDAVRDAAFTGEVACATTPAVTIHADRGRIYSAERSSDAPLSARLVDAGALTATELEHGVLRLAGAEHLGRLFERVPTVDRDAVLVTAGLLTDDCLSWLATQHVAGIDVTPYRHHPAGIQRWDPVPDVAPAAPAPLAAPPAPAAPMAPMAPPAAPFAAPPMPAPLAAAPSPGAALPAPASFAAPAAPLPAPPALAAPALAAPALASPSSAAPSFAPPPAPAATAFPTIGLPPLRTADAPDDMISWDEPGFLDEPLPGDSSFGLLRPLRLPGAAGFEESDEPIGFAERIDLSRFGFDTQDDLAVETDWVDRLDHDGLPAAGSDPLARAVSLPPLPAEPIDRFELIWPSGEIDEQFGGQPVDADPHPDRDRGGPTARLRLDGRSGRAALLQPLAPPAPAASADDASGIGRIEQFLAAEASRTAPAGPTDDVIHAVRQAAASIAAGSLAPQERRTGPRVAGMPARGEPVATPPTATGRMTRPNPAAGSVFDDVVPTAVTPLPVLPPAAHEGTDDGPERVSALRRLIGSLRRH